MVPFEYGYNNRIPKQASQKNKLINYLLNTQEKRSNKSKIQVGLIILKRNYELKHRESGFIGKKRTSNYMLFFIIFGGKKHKFP